MMSSRNARLLITIVSFAITMVSRPQQPFDLDPAFVTNIQYVTVSSALPLADGDVIISGQMRVPSDPVGTLRLGLRLNHDGSFDFGFPTLAYMGGKITPWNGKFYVGNGPGVRRLWLSGTLDTDFDMVNSPYFTSLQGGDYHVFPDGRILMSGAHTLEDTIRNFTGLHQLIWFGNMGWLDTTRIHRKGNGVVYEFERLYDGGFICTGNCSLFDGHPTDGWIFKVDSTGAIDTTFNSGVYWGRAHTFLPLLDGRCYAGGLFKITGITDTLHLVRFMPDGALDSTFNNYLDFRAIDITASYGATIAGIYPLDDSRLIITGGFETIEGAPRQAICMVDSTGQLVNDHFTGPGCGDYTYMGFTYGEIGSIVPAPDGSWYIFGAYHGYNDGTTNDPGQRMISRLYGLDVGMNEPTPDEGWQILVRPNPMSGSAVVEVKGVDVRTELVVRDPLGKERLRQRTITGENRVDLPELAPGPYTVTLEQDGRPMTTTKMVIAP
jgi:hypothetical protein